MVSLYDAAILTIAWVVVSVLVAFSLGYIAGKSKR